MEDYGITIKENVPTAGMLVVNNSGVLNIGELINYGILAIIVLQIVYTLWKFITDVKDRCNKKEDK